jgi:hypothetical protein
MLWYNIRVALLEKHLPLLDNIHGPFKMMPPELLHTSGSGFIMYMFESLRHQLGGGSDRHFINQEHIIISNIITRQSEWDYPRGLMQNGLVDRTKCQSSEQKGNSFRLMCIAHQTTAGNVLKSALNLSDCTWKNFIRFLQMYLAMEEWFHDHNNKEEVRRLRDEIAKVLTSLQKLFPRKDNSNGYRIPKMHGMTKMQEYMKLFGSAMNFLQWPG